MEEDRSEIAPCDMSGKEKKMDSGDDDRVEGGDDRAIKADIDYILENFVGTFGRWQGRFLALVLAMYGTTYLTLFLHLFAAFTPPHRCRVRLCDGDDDLGGSLEFPWVDFAIPRDHDANEFLNDGYPFNPCRQYPAIDFLGQCRGDNFDRSNASLPCQDGFLYDASVFPETLSTKFDLVCGDQYKRRFLGTLMMLGLLLGSAIGGRLGDRVGRRKALLVAAVLIGPSVTLGGLSVNYEMYAALRLLSCTCLPIIWVNCNSLLLECFATSHRITIICAKDIWWPAMLLVLGSIAYLVRHWVSLHLAVGAVCSLALAVWWALPESYLWLAENKRKEEALETLKMMARGNGRAVSELEEKLMLDTLTHIEGVSSHRHKLSFVHMFERNYLATSLVLILTWATTNVGSYTLSLNATKLTGDLFVNFALAALGEVPATVIMYFALHKTRRLSNMAASLWILGVCCLILAFIPKAYAATVLVVYLVGKCAVGAAFLLVWLITSEIYPTNLRSQAVGTCSTVARVFGLVCPFVSNLASVWKPLPMVVLGLPALVFGTLSFLYLPETFGRPLPQNMKEAMELKKATKV